MEEHTCLKHAHCRRTFSSNVDLIKHQRGCRAEISHRNQKIPKISEDGDFGVVRESSDSDIDFHESPLEKLQFEELEELQDYDWITNHKQDWNPEEYVTLQQEMYSTLYGTEALNATSFEDFAKKCQPRSCDYNVQKNFEFFSLLRTMNLTHGESQSLLDFIHNLFHQKCVCKRQTMCPLDKSFSRITTTSEKQYKFMKFKEVRMKFPDSWKMGEFKHEVRDIVIKYLDPLAQIALKFVDPLIMFHNAEHVMLEAKEIYKNGIYGAESKRVISNCMTADWAIRTQELMRRNLREIPSDERQSAADLIFTPFINYSDGVSVGFGKHVTQNSALASIGNFSIPFSKNELSKFSLGYIPDLQDFVNVPQLKEHLLTVCGFTKTFIKDDLKYFQLELDRGFWTSIHYLISKCWKEGARMFVLGEGGVKEIHTAYAHQIGDMPAQRKQATIKATSCNSCLWKPSECIPYDRTIHSKRDFRQIVELTKDAHIIRDKQRSGVKLSEGEKSILHMCDELGIYPIFNVHNAVASGMLSRIHKMNHSYFLFLFL
jgi:hypothetical protein